METTKGEPFKLLTVWVLLYRQDLRTHHVGRVSVEVPCNENGIPTIKPGDILTGTDLRLLRDRGLNRYSGIVRMLDKMVLDDGSYLLLTHTFSVRKFTEDVNDMCLQFQVTEYPGRPGHYNLIPADPGKAFSHTLLPTLIGAPTQWKTQ